VPDAPSTLFWTATLWGLLKAKVSGKAEWWLIASLTAGLATLSKYSALFLAPGVFLWLVLTPEGRAELKRPWPWLTAVIAAAIFGLNAAWNAQHHWESFSKQFGRAAPGALTPKYLGELIVGQLILLNPLIAAFAWRPFDLRRLKAWGVELSLFLATVAPFAVYLVLHSLHARVQAHWPAPLYPALALMAATAAEAAPAGSLWAGLRRAAAPLGLALTIAALAYTASGVHLMGKKDPALQLLGWPAFAQKVEAERTGAGAAWVGTLSYGVAGQLAARPEIKAPVLQLEERERYVFLPATGADLSKPGLVVDLARREGDLALKACFAKVEALGALQRGPKAARGTLYAVWRVSGPRRIVEGGCAP
jgi:4-amino-4-deoxy-L-arabinose transferase-like glycosyltransferase